MQYQFCIHFYTKQCNSELIVILHWLYPSINRSKNIFCSSFEMKYAISNTLVYYFNISNNTKCVDSRQTLLNSYHATVSRYIMWAYRSIVIVNLCNKFHYLFRNKNRHKSKTSKKTDCVFQSYKKIRRKRDDYLCLFFLRNFS